MKIKIGPTQYTVALRAGYLRGPSGHACLGLCDLDACLIQISDVPPPAQRLAVLWHEVAHAAWASLAHGAEQLEEEAAADLIGLAMASITPQCYAAAHHLMVHGVEPDDLVIVAASGQRVDCHRG